MALEIKSFFEYAKLSMASYTGFASYVPQAVSDALYDQGRGDFTLSLADNFAGLTTASPGYTVLSQSPSTITSLGFSATLFLDNATGQKILAVRGTNDPFDLFITDALIGTLGLANQYANLESYYQQLVNEGKLGANESFAVTGHSLGGFLAQAFAVDYAGVVSQTYTYNAPGFGGIVTNLLNLLGVTNTNIALANITNLAAQPGLNLASGLGTVLGNVQPIFIEEQSNPISNHFVKHLTDALSVYDLFAHLAPAVSLDTVTNVLKAASYTRNTSSTTDKSLENALDAVRRLIADYQQGTSSANVTATIPNDRDDFYKNLLSLQSEIKSLSIYNPDTQSLGLNVTSLVDAHPGGLVAGAKFSAATRYALYKLNPFIVTGNAALYDQINTDGSLTLYDSATGTGNLSDQYLKDRSAFLTNKILSGVGDKSAQSGDPLAIRNGSPLYFEDRGSASTYGLYQGENNAVSEIPFEEISQIIFGHTGTDLIGGGDQSDHLYGMNGADTLQGKLGNDYLEGGAGDDTYLYTSGDGLDTLLDTDGLGKITFDGTILNGGNKLVGETYRSSDGNYLYTMLPNASGQDLLISAMGGQIIVKDFQSGELGIALDDQLVEAPAGLPPIADVDLHPDGSATYNGTPAAESATGTPYNDVLFGNGGGDRLEGQAGRDWLLAGSGPAPIPRTACSTAAPGAIFWSAKPAPIA